MEHRNDQDFRGIGAIKNYVREIPNDRFPNIKIHDRVPLRILRYTSEYVADSTDKR
jgi:hypothetical protein